MQKKFSPRKPKSARDKLQVPFAVYSNIACTVTERFFATNEISENKDHIEQFLDKQRHFKPAEKVGVWKQMKQNINVLDRFETEATLNLLEGSTTTEDEAIICFDITIELLKLLAEIRNSWSHFKHKEPELTNIQLRSLIQELYNLATMESNVNLPEKYARELGLLFLERNNVGKVWYKDKNDQDVRGELTDKLSLTGQIFIISLFLNRHEVNDFLTDLEQGLYEFDEIKKRQEYKELHPNEEYPPELRNAGKPFLFARDVYTCFAIRGHRDTLKTTDEAYYKEKAFSLLEYLKRCPGERLISRVAVSKRNKVSDEYEPDFEPKERDSSDPTLGPQRLVQIGSEDYPVREKNKFMEFAVAFLEEEWQLLNVGNTAAFEWRWAHHAPASTIKKLRDDLKDKNPLDRVPQHKKMVWEVPNKDEQLLNSQNDYEGYPYYFDRDDMGNYSHAVFKLTHREITVTGKLSANLLCTLLENYFERFPIDVVNNNNRANINDRRTFFEQIFRGLHQHMISESDKGRHPKEKTTITPETILKRLDYLRRQELLLHQTIEQEDEKNQNERSAFKTDNNHAKVTYIAQTWNKAITYGQTNNLAHAADYNGITGGKKGYHEIQKYLSLMGSDKMNHEEARQQLINTLKKLGNRNNTSYYDAINRQIQQSGIMGNSGSPYPLKKNKTLNDFYEQARHYRTAMLNHFETRACQTFDPDDWRPNAEMRWLGLRDDRTPVGSQNLQQKPKESNTGIYNADKHYYTPMGVQHWQLLTSRGDTDPEHNTHVLKIKHSDIYPSPHDNCLLIEEFYNLETEKWNILPRTDRNRLYAIRRQDTILSHLAYHYSKLSEGENYSGRDLNSSHFQNDEMMVPVPTIQNGDLTTAFVKMFYRHFKQNRYRLLPKQVSNIMEILLSNGLISNNTITFNNLVLKSKSDLTQQERWMYLSNEELKASVVEKDKTANEKLVLIKEDRVLVKVPYGEGDRFYLTDVLTDYNFSRISFLSQLIKLEKAIIRNFGLKPGDKGYISFKQITDALIQNEVLTKTEVQRLRDLRNCAMHNQVPAGDLLPVAGQLIRLTKKKKGEIEKEYIEFFGYGIDMVKNLNTTQKINKKSCEK